MMYDELGRYPIYIDIKIRTVFYWARLIVDKQTKYSYILYRKCRQLNENHNMQFSWILFVIINIYPLDKTSALDRPCYQQLD
jgi:hypothetical protein